MTQRDTFLDFCKGTAIFLVVLGHVLQKVIHIQDGVFDFIYLFHMPFFFMLSGYLACSVHSFAISFFLKKARTLLLPFATVGLLFTCINGEYSSFFFSDFHNGYWFLFSLFCIWCLFSIVKSIVSCCHIDNALLELVILFLPFIIIRGGQNWLPPLIVSSLSIDFTCAFYRFFVIGYFIGKYATFNTWFQRKWVKILGTVCFILLFILSYIVDMKYIIPFTITQILLCFGFLSLLRFLYDRYSNKICNRIECYGRMSLEIYVFHYFMLMLI